MCISVNNTKINLLKNGNIKSITRDNLQFNLFQGNESDTPIINVYATKDGYRHALLSNEYLLETRVYDNGVIYTSDFNGNKVVTTFTILDSEIINVTIKSEVADVFTYTFDMGAGDIGFLDDKEAYASQYIDCKVFDEQDFFSIAMRRTLGQSTGYPQIEVFTKNEVVDYATEGYDFYPLEYKNTNKIKYVKLPSRQKNYEMAFSAMEFAKSDEINVFIKLVNNNDQAISNSIISEEELVQVALNEEKFVIANNKNVLEIINGEQVNLSDYYSNMHLVEKEEDEIISFFTDESAHVVAPTKENLIQRMHGNIITTGNSIDLSRDILVSSNYINGVFSAQNAVGNVGQNTLNSNIHSNLDLQKVYGQRIMINIDGTYKLLNAPSFYEMGMNYSKWVYLLAGEKIEVITYTDVDVASLTLTVSATKDYDFIICDDYRDCFTYNVENSKVNYTFKADTFQGNILPNLNYNIDYTGGIVGFGDDNRYQVTYNNTKEITIITSASKNANLEFPIKPFSEAQAQYSVYISNLTNDMSLKLPGNEDIEMFNHLIKWYTHNALIHFATPHGLEQHAGSAWGTRDVCQGPLEFFIAFGKFDIAKKVLLEIFKNQTLEDGTWPQWFMFDEYSNIRADDYHGDIIVWPIKIMADYINMSGDYSILNEEVAYWSFAAGKFTEEKYTILDHLNKEIAYIEDNYISGTHISSYGHGDWDDTLQPANQKLRDYMASGWTVPLTYQAFTSFANALKMVDETLASDIQNKADLIKADFKKYMIHDDVVTGFAYLEDLNKIKYMLHPSDTDTNIKYRLLPINRSIISGLFNNSEVASHLEIVNNKLKCPDGVRLMDNPAPYNGGTMTYFQRGESASTVGREISLQYVHAHIRYIESMLKLGNASEAFAGFLCVNPFTIQKHVPNAMKRQANAYFSSSEGDFDNRYTYAKEFGKLKTGDIAVKGGWRIYSSGPGIYLNQFVGNFLGLKYLDGQMVIDPVIPKELKGLVVEYTYGGNKFILDCQLESSQVTFNGECLNNQLTEVYRLGGYVIENDKIKKENKIIIG